MSLPSGKRVRRPGIVAHRPVRLDPADVTTPPRHPRSPAHHRTLVDIAPRLTERQLEAAVNRADKLGLVDPERLLDYVAGA